jgi:esterase/lipase superfamily enzyme
VAPRPERMPVEDSTIKEMCWRSVDIPESEKEPVKPRPGVNANVPDRKMSGDEIVAAVRKYMESSGKTEIVIFVHGCCATFDTSMERAARVAAHMQVPVILYDWVSPKGFSRYLENETLLEQTQDGFFDFLAEVETLFPERPITLIGHSMGAQFLDSALTRRFERYSCKGEIPRYKEIIFASADVDALSYIRHAEKVAANGKTTRIYVNNKDDRLDASSFAHGGFSRLGAPGNLLPGLCNTPGQDVIDDTALKPGHELPFDLVANMHRFGKPGNEGEFDLVPKGKNLFVFEKLQTKADN